MTDIAVPIDTGRPLHCTLANRLSVGLTLLGVLVACAMTWAAGMPIPIGQPAVFALASVILLAPSKGRHLPVLQKIVALYLVALLFNELYPQYITLSVASKSLSVSHSLWPFLLCAAGALAARLRMKSESIEIVPFAVMSSWLLALSIIVAHMVVLAVLFRAFYGYGYENDLGVLAHLSLYFLLLLAFWKQLDRSALRRLIGLILLVFYSLVTFVR